MSPAATISLDDAERSILATADELFYRHGVRTVTMADLRDGAEVSMRRLYSLFPTKSDVVTGWLHHRHITWLEAITNDVARRIANQAEPLDAVFAAIEEWLVATDFRGCAFINTHAETSDDNPEHQQIIRDHKDAFDDYVSALIPGVPALAVLIDGAIVQSSLYSSTKPLRSAHELARQGTRS